MPLVVNISNLKTKLICLLIIFTVFLVLNKTLGPEEFGLTTSIPNFDIFYHTVLTQVGIYDTTHLKPASVRAKIITATHLTTFLILILI